MARGEGVPRVQDHGVPQVSPIFILLFFSSLSSHLKLTRILLSSSKRCNKLPILTDTKDDRTTKFFKKIGPGGYFNVLTVLRSWTFCRFFTTDRVETSISGGDDDKSKDGATSSSDAGESRHLRDECF